MTEPVLHIPLTVGEAAKALTGFETIGIEDRWRTPMESLSSVKVLIGVVWAHRRRMSADQKSAVTWADVEAMTLAAMEGFFEAEPDALDEDAEGNSEPA